MTIIKNSVSIGICTSNDEKSINRLLDSLTKNFKFKVLHINEIIIVSSGCIDSTEEIIQKFIDKFPNLITLVSEKYRSGKSNALNEIFKLFSGNYLVLIPADAYTSLNSIQILVEKMNENKNIGITFGRPIIDHENHYCTAICKMSTSLWNLHIQGMTLIENTHASGELMILSKDSVISIPENVINDDAYLSQKVFEGERKIVFEPNAVVFITSPVTFKDYINQRKRIYLGHKQLKEMGFSQTVPFNKLLTRNKLFYLKIFFQEIKTIKRFTYLSLALIVEFYLKLSIKFNVKNQFTNNTVWKRISVDFIPSRKIFNQYYQK